MFFFQEIEVDNNPCVLEILDTAGTEQFASMRDLYIKNGQVNDFFYFMKNNLYIRVIPQSTFNNNLGPYHLAGPKALEPNYCRTNPFIGRPLSGSPNCTWF